MAKRTSDRPVAGFNLVAVIGGEGLCLHFDGTLRPVALGPGTHIISSNRDLNDPSMPEKGVFERWRSGLQAAPDETTLVDYLRSHEGDRPVCKHGEEFGTVSSTIYTRNQVTARLLHAEGPPCRTPFQDLSHLAPTPVQ